MRRALLPAALMVITALLAVGIATADPINSPNAARTTMDCGGQPVEVVTLFTNRAVVTNVVTTTENFVGTKFTGTVTITDPQTGEVLFQEPFVFHPGSGQKAGLQESLTTCHETFSTEDPDLGLVTVDLTVTGFFTPRAS